MAYIFKSFGNFSESIKILPKSTGIRHDGRVHYALSKLTDYEVNSPHIWSMQNILQNENISSENNMYLDFALAKAFEDVGEYSRSFTHYSRVIM